MLAMAARPDGWEPPVLTAVATTGEGVAELAQKLDEFRTFGAKGVRDIRRREQCRARLLELLRQALFEKAVRENLRDGELESRVQEVLARRRDPHSVVEELIAESTASGRAKRKSKH